MLAGLLLQLGLAHAEPPVPSPVSHALTEVDIDKRLDAGSRILKQGIPGRAIHDYFDPVIQNFEQSYPSGGQQVFSAHFHAESLMYLLHTAADAEAGGARKDATVIDGRWSDALLLKAYALVELQRPVEAEAVLKQAIGISPLYPPLWLELGYLYEQQRAWKEAKDAFERAADGTRLIDDETLKKEQLGSAWRGQGYVLTETGHLDESEALYRKCLELDAKDYKALHELEYVQGLREQQERASGVMQPPAPSVP